MPCASSQSVPDLLKNSFCKTLNRANRSFERFALAQSGMNEEARKEAEKVLNCRKTSTGGKDQHGRRNKRG